MLLYNTSVLYLFLPSDSLDAEGLQRFKSSHGMKKCGSKKKKAASTEIIQRSPSVTSELNLKCNYCLLLYNLTLH